MPTLRLRVGAAHPQARSLPALQAVRLGDGEVKPLPAILKPFDGDLDAHNRELAALKAKGLRAEKAINLGLRYAPEGTEIQAPRTIGECPAGDGRINYGDGAIRRNRKWWHESCDPRPEPVFCGHPGCGVALPNRQGIGGVSACEGCYEMANAALWFCRGLTGHFAPQKLNLRGFRR